MREGKMEGAQAREHEWGHIAQVPGKQKQDPQNRIFLYTYCWCWCFPTSPLLAFLSSFELRPNLKRQLQQQSCSVNTRESQPCAFIVARGSDPDWSSTEVIDRASGTYNSEMRHVHVAMAMAIMVWPVFITECDFVQTFTSRGECGLRQWRWRWPLLWVCKEGRQDGSSSSSSSVAPFQGCTSGLLLNPELSCCFVGAASIFVAKWIQAQALPPPCPTSMSISRVRPRSLSHRGISIKWYSCKKRWYSEASRDA